MAWVGRDLKDHLTEVRIKMEILWFKLSSGEMKNVDGDKCT